MTKHAITIIVAIFTIVGCTGHPLVLPPGFELALPQSVYPVVATPTSAGSSGSVVEQVQEATILHQNGKCYRECGSTTTPTCPRDEWDQPTEVSFDGLTWQHEVPCP